MNAPSSNPQGGKQEPKRGVLFRQRPDRESDWGSWELATLGIPSLMAKAQDRPDEYQVEEVMPVSEYVEVRDALLERAERGEKAEKRLKEVERQREEERTKLIEEGRAEIEKHEARADQATCDQQEAEVKLGEAEAALAERQEQVREAIQELGEEASRRRSSATGIAEEENCTDLTPSEYRERQRLEGEADRLGEIVDQLRESLTQPSSNPPQQDREDGEDIAGKLQAGYSLCHPENDCAGLRAWAKVSGEVEEAADYLDGLGKETMVEAEGGGGLDPESVDAQRLASKAEGYFDAAEYLRTELLTQPEADPEVPRCTGTADCKCPYCACPTCGVSSDCQPTPELLGEAIALFEIKEKEAGEQGGDPVAESYLREVVLPELRRLQEAK